MIRLATEEDIPSICDMASRFWEHADYEEEYNPGTTIALAKQCIENDMMLVAVTEDGLKGFACGVIAPLLGNPNVLSGTEIAWWVEPDYRKTSCGISLLLELEEQAKKNGAKYWNMVYMESSMPTKVKQLYERLGYKKVETVYRRVL